MSTQAVDEPVSGEREGTIRLTTAQALVRFLQAQWSERDGERRRLIPAIFGIFGHGNVCGIAQALVELGDQLPFHQPKNEQSMVHTAIGYAKASRRMATLACSASIGPGSTNMISGAATATTNRLPVLLLPSDTFANRCQGPVLQQLQHPSEADTTVNDCLRPVSRFFDRIARPEQLLTALPEAMRVLLDPADTGAVTISLHQDVQGEAYDFPGSFFEQRTWLVARRPPAAEELAAALELLRGARRPLIIAGGGVRYSNAEEQLASFAQRFGVPVAETSAGKGSLSCEHELLVGGIGVNGTRAANALAAQADVVLCIGTRLSDFTTASHSLFQHSDVRFVAVNVCSADAHRVGATPVLADARLALEAFEDGLRERGWSTAAEYREEVAERLESWNVDLAEDLEPREDERMSQGQVLRELNNAVRARDWVVAAAGYPPGDLLKIWRVIPGSAVHLEFAYSCMGHEIPAGLGIRMAAADAGEIFVVIGDGTFLMANSELLSAIQDGLKITVVLLVNGGYQSIHGLQRGSTGVSFGNEFRARDGAEDRISGATLEVDYLAIAAGMGCATFEAHDLQAVRDALAVARSEKRACVIACHVEPLRGLLGSGAFWDLGVPATSGDPQVRALSAAHERAASAQRFYYFSA